MLPGRLRVPVRGLADFVFNVAFAPALVDVRRALGVLASSGSPQPPMQFSLLRMSIQLLGVLPMTTH